jgi:hypothetical protein
MNNEEIIELAKECGAFSHTEFSNPPTQLLWTFYPLELESFAAALTEPLEKRIAELEEALKGNMYSNSTDLAIKLGTEALANKSDWLEKHDAEVRREVLQEVQYEITVLNRECRLAEVEGILYRMAQGAKE